MEKTHRKFLIPDKTGRGNHLGLEVNWNKMVGNSEKIRLFTAGGEEVVIDRKDLLSLLFVFGDEDDQQQLINVGLQEQLVHETMFEVTTTRPYMKGEKLVVRLPVEVQSKVLQARDHKKFGLGKGVRQF